MIRQITSIASSVSGYRTYHDFASMMDGIAQALLTNAHWPKYTITLTKPVLVSLDRLLTRLFKETVQIHRPYYSDLQRILDSKTGAIWVAIPYRDLSNYMILLRALKVQDCLHRRHTIQAIIYISYTWQGELVHNIRNKDDHTLSELEVVNEHT